MTNCTPSRKGYERSKKNDIEVSKFMSWGLRHAPKEAGITLDPFGWTTIENLKGAIEAHFGVHMQSEDFFHIINSSDKKRFELDSEAYVVRAAQGHSIEVDLQLAPMIPTNELFHGTQEANIEAIKTHGLQKRDRHHVHLSESVGTAIAVARRRKGPHTIIQLDVAKMVEDGVQFFMTSNRVWLVDHVDPIYFMEFRRPEDF